MTRTIRPWQMFSKLGKDDRDISYRIPSEPGVVSGTVSSLDTLLLIAAIRLTKARTLLEWGTGLGYNALHLCRNTDVAITTIDNEQRPFVYDKQHNVKQIICDVADYIPDLTPDMIFYDVNIPGLTEHGTEASLALNPRIMAWHDYGHPLVPHVKAYLDTLPLDIIHVEDSLMAFYFRDGLEISK